MAMLGHFSTKKAAVDYAAKKNKFARKYVYRAVHEPFYGIPGYKGVKVGWTIMISKKKTGR